MEKFCIKFADIVISVSAEFPETKAYCTEFLTEEKSEIEIVMAAQDRERARQILTDTYKYLGRLPEESTEILFENSALLFRISDELIRYNAVLFHGCTVAVNGKAYIFCADPGTGKSTHAMLWVKNIPDCHILNGDKPFLLFKNDSIYACGGPWRGKEGIGTNEILPLAGICLLNRDTTNHIAQVSFKEAFQQLLRHSYCPGDTNNILQYMKMMQKLTSVPIYRLGCNMEDEAAFVSYDAMVKK